MQRFLHDGLEISVEENDAHKSVAKNLWGQAADEILQRTAISGSVLHYAQDLQGNVSEVMDSMGRVAEAYRYDPFGVPSGTSAIGNPFLFAGTYYDAASGLSDSARDGMRQTLGVSSSRIRSASLPV